MPEPLTAIPTGQLAWLRADVENEQGVLADRHRREREALEARRAELDAELRRRLIPGEVISVDDATAVLCETPKPVGSRSVDRDAIHRHIETLGPMGLGPQDDPRPRPPKYPTVAELERHEARLLGADISLDELVIVPPLGEPKIVVKAIAVEAPA